MRVERDARAREVTRSDERVFLPDRKNPVVLRRNSTALFLLQRVRDEAHRFAITYHRELRRRERLRSALDDIAGHRPGAAARAAAPLRQPEALCARRREAEIAAVPGISSRGSRPRSTSGSPRPRPAADGA